MAPAAAVSLHAVAAGCLSAGADELFVRTGDSPTPSQLDALGRLTARLAAPLLVRAEADADTCTKLLDAGVARVIIERAALADPDTIARLVGRFGMETVGVAITATAEPGGGWRVCRGSGGAHTEWSAVDWARVVEAQGAGELVVGVGDQDGKLDLELLEAVSSAVARPTMAIVAGGHEEALDALLIGDADAIALQGDPGGLAASVRQVKRMVAEHGLPVRG